MTNLSPLSTTPKTKTLASEVIKNGKMWLLSGMLLTSLAGFIDATFLTIKYYQHETPPCSLLKGCEVVTTSAYADIFGIPIALLGSIYYLTVFLLVFGYFDLRKESFLKIISALTALGFLISLCLVGIQLFVLRAICLYCMFSALTSTVLFMLSLLLRHNRFRLSSPQKPLAHT